MATPRYRVFLEQRDKWLRVAVRTATLLFLLWLAFLVFVWWAMRQPPDRFGRVMKHMPLPAYFLFPFETMWTHARAGVLHPGDAAPDFDLPTYDKTSHVQLAGFRGRQPVVLVFGSYT